MKKTLILAGILTAALCGFAKADQTPPDVVNSTATITIVTVSSSAATALTTNATPMKYRSTYAVQNVGNYQVWCKFDNTVTVSNGWVIPAGGMFSVPIVYYSGMTDAILRLYCIAETGSNKMAVLEAY